MFLCLLLRATAVLAILIRSASTTAYAPIKPPSYPIAVKNPYLSAWLPGNQVDVLPHSSPQFWTGGRNLTWGILGRVNGQTYNIFGIYNNQGRKDATVVSATYTASHTIFELTAGTATFVLDFFSPVSPSNFVRQSLPFSYLTINTSSTTAADIQIYSDIDDTWTGQSGRTAVAHQINGPDSIYTMSVQDSWTYREETDMALWGSVIFASRLLDPHVTSKISSALGDHRTVRSGFVDKGLATSNQMDWKISGPNGDVVAFSHNLGSVTSTQSVEFAIGYTREKAINYLGNPQTGYYRSQYANEIAALTGFFDDYPAALNESHSLDSKIDFKASSISKNYSDIVNLSVRQTFGAMDLTIPLSSLSTSNPMAFIKEISSDGNLNTMDIIFPASPMFFVLDSTWIGMLLEPMMRYLKSGGWPYTYLLHDMGLNYPNATGHTGTDDSEKMPIEATSSLVILANAYAKSSPSGVQWANKWQHIIQRYTNYLSSPQTLPPCGATSTASSQIFDIKAPEFLNMPSQLSQTDAIPCNANQTHLAIKQAVALKAFGSLFPSLSNSSAYTSAAESAALALTDATFATANQESVHFTLHYPNPDAKTWFTAAHLFPDALLGLDTFNTSTYQMQSSFYPTVRDVTGVAIQSPLPDAVNPWARTDIMLWAAAAATDKTIRNMFIDDIHAYLVGEGSGTAPFGDRFYIGGKNAGMESGWRARPVVGGHFAMLAKELGANSITA